MSTGSMLKWIPRPPAVPSDCAHCRIKGLTVCAPLQSGRLHIVQDFKLGDRVLPARSQLYAPGQPPTELYNLLDGWVMLYRILKSGTRQILDFALPGAFLGYQPDPTAVMLHGAECITDVAVCVFPRVRFEDLAHRHPDLALQLAKLTSRRLIRAQGYLTNIGSRPGRARVAHLLIELFYGLRRLQALPHGDGVEIPLTQTHIAEALGLTNVHVSKILRELREEGLVVFRGGRLRILQVDRLAELAEFDLGADLCEI